MKLFWFAISAAIGGFTCGFHYGGFGGELLLIQDQQSGWFSTESKESIASATFLAAFLPGTMVTALAFDRWGRRPVLIALALALTLLPLILAFAQNEIYIYVGRVLIGFAVGGLAGGNPPYIAELCVGSQHRGRYVMLHNLLWNQGQFLANVVNAAASYTHDAFRYGFGLSILSSLIHFLLLLFFLPESPRWLVHRGEYDKASAVLDRIDQTSSATSLKKIDESRVVHEARFKEFWRSGLRQALIVALCLQVAQQFSGFTSLLFYAPQILDAGDTAPLSERLWLACTVSGARALMSYFTVLLVDRLGRRVLLVISAGLGAVFMLCLGIAFHFNASNYILAILVFLFTVAYSIGLGPVPSTYTAEIFPDALRSRGTGLSQFVNGLLALLVAVSFLPFTAVAGEAPTFWMFSGICAVSAVLMLMFVHETKKLTFEEIQMHYRHHLRAAGMRPKTRVVRSDSETVDVEGSAGWSPSTPTPPSHSSHTLSVAAVSTHSGSAEQQ